MPDRPAVLFGRQLRAARERLGLSQRELARRVRMTGPGISGYETGTRMPPLDVALDLAKICGISLDALTAGPCAQCSGRPPKGVTCRTCGTGAS